MPQFNIYASYANEQKLFQLNIVTVNDYLKNMFGGREAKAVRTGAPTMVECEIDFSNKVNNIERIAKARDSLVDKTGRKEFKMGEIIKEINALDKDRKLKYRFDDDNKAE